MPGHWTRGVGIGNARVRNMTLLAKWIWQFYHEADTLCHNVIISKYGPRPFNWIGGVVKSTSRNPWKDISSEFSLLSQFIQGMGGDTYFWKDKYFRD